MALSELLSSLTKDPLGGFFESTLSASHGYTIATYVFQPKCGIASAKAVMFLMHGIFVHSPFQWLESDKGNHRTLLQGSIVEQLLELDIVVIAYDHPGHGKSSGLRSYVDSHDHLRDVGIDVINHFMDMSDLKTKKKMLMGISMGGTNAIRVCMREPDLLDVVVLLSPAVQPPDDTFGVYGKFLKMVSPVLGCLIPKVPVIKLPMPEQDDLREAMEKDELNYHGALRVKMGTEFLRVYSEIDDEADGIRFKSVVMIIGKKDDVVSPSSVTQFHQRVQSDDKAVMEFDDIGHDVFRESGYQDARDQLIEWLEGRL